MKSLLSILCVVFAVFVTSQAAQATGVIVQAPCVHGGFAVNSFSGYGVNQFAARPLAFQSFAVHPFAFQSFGVRAVRVRSFGVFRPPVVIQRRGLFAPRRVLIR